MDNSTLATELHKVESLGNLNEKQLATMTWKEILKVSFDILNYPLFDLDGHPISLGKLLTGLVLLFIGYLVARRGATEVDRRVLNRLSLEQSLRYTFRRLTFYFLLFLTTLFTLHILAVPVTIFTVLGGAVAVGIGFGSQNLINNFISGILVMVERPIRVGDSIEVDGVSGTVESIGIRTTIIRNGVNAVIVVPNTVFIDKKLTNWTVSENIQCTIRVGVAYSTDIEKFRQVALQAVSGNEFVLATPPPAITFVDFGDSTLLFDIGYYIAVSSVPLRGTIASDLRFKIHELFTQNQIEMPFPQRQVRMLT